MRSVRWYHIAGAVIAVALVTVQWRMFLGLAAVYGAALLLNLIIPVRKKRK